MQPHRTLLYTLIASCTRGAAEAHHARASCVRGHGLAFRRQHARFEPGCPSVNTRHAMNEWHRVLIAATARPVSVNMAQQPQPQPQLQQHSGLPSTSPLEHRSPPGPEHRLSVADNLGSVSQAVSPPPLQIPPRDRTATMDLFPLQLGVAEPQDHVWERLPDCDGFVGAGRSKHTAVAMGSGANKAPSRRSPQRMARHPITPVAADSGRPVQAASSLAATTDERC